MKFLGGFATGIGVAHMIFFHNGWGAVLIAVGALTGVTDWERNS